jgi:hypothetical protein
MPGYASAETRAAFTASYTLFDGLVAWLAGDQSAGMTHAELEERLHAEGLGLLRQLLQDSLDLRAVREERLPEVIDADGYRRGRVESAAAGSALTKQSCPPSTSGVIGVMMAVAPDVVRRGPTAPRVPVSDRGTGCSGAERGYDSVRGGRLDRGGQGAHRRGAAQASGDRIRAAYR